MNANQPEIQCDVPAAPVEAVIPAGDIVDTTEFPFLAEMPLPSPTLSMTDAAALTELFNNPAEVVIPLPVDDPIAEESETVTVTELSSESNELPIAIETRSGEPTSRKRKRKRGRKNHLRGAVTAFAKQLSLDHYRDVMSCPHRVKQALSGVVGITWLNNGQRFRPLGSTSMLVQYSDDYGHPTQVCIGPRPQLSLDGPRPVILYDRVRMVHDWGINPRPGGYRRVLDPRFAGDPSIRRGEMPNGPWVLAGLRVHAARRRAIDQATAMAPAPKMPVFMVAYANAPVFTGMTPFLASELVAQGKYPVADDPALFAARPPADALASARELFQSYVYKPEHTGLSLYLVPLDCVPSLFGNERIYEDFGHMLGVSVPNPLCGLSGITAPNPVWDAARERRVHLKNLLAEVRGEVGPMSDESVEVRVNKLMSGMRQHLGKMATMFRDDDLIFGILHPEQALVSTTVVNEKSEAERIEYVRQGLPPDLVNVITDEELTAAATGSPYEPVYVSHMVEVQCIRRQCDLALRDSLTFPAAALGRDDVTAAIYADEQWEGSGSTRRRSLPASPGRRSDSRKRSAGGRSLHR